MSNQYNHLRDKIYTLLEYVFYPEALQVVVNKKEVYIKIVSFHFTEDDDYAVDEVQSFLYEHFYEDLHNDSRMLVISAYRPCEDMADAHKESDYEED